MRATNELWQQVKEMYKDKRFIDEYKKSCRSNQDSDSPKAKNTARAVNVE